MILWLERPAFKHFWDDIIRQLLWVHRQLRVPPQRWRLQGLPRRGWPRAWGVEATSLGTAGTAAVGAISGAAGGAASGFAYSAGLGESPLQIAESTGENALFGAAGWLVGNLLRASAIAAERAATQQIQDFLSFSKRANVTIIRPSSLVTNGDQGCYGIIQ